MDFLEDFDVTDFNVTALLETVNSELAPLMRECHRSLHFEYGPADDVRLRGNQERLRETLVKIVKGAIRQPDLKHVLMRVQTEPLPGRRVLLQFEIQSLDGDGPTFRFYAGLPQARLPRLLVVRA